jgi:hypothetical protein
MAHPKARRFGIHSAMASVTAMRKQFADLRTAAL